MTPKEMQDLLRKKPFEPFRIYLEDGRAFEIRNPRLNLVTEETLVIGLSDPVYPDPWIAEHAVYVGWEFIRKWEPIPAIATY